jgi:hypothetical protein
MREIHLNMGGRAMRAFFRLRQDIEVQLARVTRGAVVDLNDLADRLSLGRELGSAGWAFASALRALDRAQRWETALAAAEAQPERFRDSARYLADQVSATQPLDAWSPRLSQAIEILTNLSSFDDPTRAAQALRKAAVPTPVTNVFASSRGAFRRTPEATAESEPVVHLRFDVEDRPVAWPLALEANHAYMLRMVARADVWPTDAEALEVTLQGVPSAVLSLSPIAIARGAERGETWMVMGPEIPFDHPAELEAVVRFVGGDRDRVAHVVGHRRLRVTTLDPGLATGQPFVGQKIVEMLGELKARIPALPAQDRRDFVALLDATAAFASLALERDDLVGIDEQAFQQKLKQAFVQDQRIGRDIREGTRLGGGIVDLILRRINDELKVIHEPVDIADADRLVGQPTQYGAGTDAPVSILTVLDDSPKDAAPGIPANYIRWVYPQLHGAAQPAAPSMVAVVIIRVGYRRPHEWTNTPTQDHPEPDDQTPGSTQGKD